MLSPLLFCCCFAFQQIDTDFFAEESLPVAIADTTLCIINVSPCFYLYPDSAIAYQLRLNRNPSGYTWYLKNNPPAVQLDSKTGMLYIKASATLFRQQKMFFGHRYVVSLGVQNNRDPTEWTDTSFAVIFQDPAIARGQIIPSVAGDIFAEEGDTIRFTLGCDNGNALVQSIKLSTSVAIGNYTSIQRCDDVFMWAIPFDFIRDRDSLDLRELRLTFVSIDDLQKKDTAEINIVIRQGINYVEKNQEYRKTAEEVKKYVQSLKLTFYVLNKSLRFNKFSRALFDVSAALTALAPAVIPEQQDEAKTGSGWNVSKLLPGIGLTLIPIKESLVPVKVQERANANQVRAVAKKLEFALLQNNLIGHRDPAVLNMICNLHEELRQARMQLIEVPLMEFDEDLSIEDAESYFKNYRTHKRHRLKMD